MAADLTQPFKESCCDGGAGSYASSAQSCGCDPGEHWVCELHKREEERMPKQCAYVSEFRDPLQKHLQKVVNKTWNYTGRLKDRRDHLLNAVMGLAAEAGEVLDEHKKLLFHSEKDRTKAIRAELGDVCYYLAKLLELYDWSLDDVLEDNRKKLKERYPDHGIV